MGFIDDEDLRRTAASNANRTAVEAQRNTYTPDKPGWMDGFNAGVEGREPTFAQTSTPEGWVDGYRHGCAYRSMAPVPALPDHELGPWMTPRVGRRED